MKSGTTTSSMNIDLFFLNNKVKPKDRPTRHECYIKRYYFKFLFLSRKNSKMLVKTFYFENTLRFIINVTKHGKQAAHLFSSLCKKGPS